MDEASRGAAGTGTETATATGSTTGSTTGSATGSTTGTGNGDEGGNGGRGRPGRPRSARTHRAILAAVISMLPEQSFDAMSIEGIARRAGVGKAAIYRRWSSKEELLLEAVEHFVQEIEVPDTGGVEEDLLHLMRDAVAVYRGPAGAAIPGLVSALAGDDALAASLRGAFLAERRARLKKVLERGVRRGELREDIDYELALDVLGGPLFYRLLITGGALDEELARGTVAVLLRGTTRAHPADGSKRDDRHPRTPLEQENDR